MLLHVVVQHVVVGVLTLICVQLGGEAEGLSGPPAGSGGGGGQDPDAAQQGGGFQVGGITEARDQRHSALGPIEGESGRPDQQPPMHRPPSSNAEGARE